MPQRAGLVSSDRRPTKSFVQGALCTPARAPANRARATPRSLAIRGRPPIGVEAPAPVHTRSSSNSTSCPSKSNAKTSTSNSRRLMARSLGTRCRRCHSRSPQIRKDSLSLKMRRLQSPSLPHQVSGRSANLPQYDILHAIVSDVCMLLLIEEILHHPKSLKS